MNFYTKPNKTRMKLMKSIYLLLILPLFITSCGLTKATVPSTGRPTDQISLNTSTIPSTPTIQASLTHTPTTFPSTIPLKSPTATKTPYPTPPGVLSREELQKKIYDWVSGEIKLTDADRLLDEKTGKPIRLGILDKPIFGEVIFIFYNLGFTIIEDEQGTPYLLDIVGFEDGNGDRFTFSFHNGKLFRQEQSLILQEFKGKRINYGEQISYDTLTPLQFIQKSRDLIGYVTGGITTIGSNGRGDEGDAYMQASKEITNDLTDFLDCSGCSIADIPMNLEKYINKIPDKYEPTLPYIWIYKVSY